MSVDLSALSLPDYETICELPLEVGYFPGYKSDKYAMAGMSAMVIWQATNWEVRAFPSLRHMLGVLSNWTPDILITHWHGDDYSVKELEDAVEQLRRLRGGARIGKGPFLVGQYSSNDDRFWGVEGEKRISEMLDSLYDMVFEREISEVAWNVAIGLWNKLNYEAGKGTSIIPFDHGFEAFISGVGLAKKHSVPRLSSGDTKRRNKERNERSSYSSKLDQSKRDRNREELRRLMDLNEAEN
jgi:hypothetical protein